MKKFFVRNVRPCDSRVKLRRWALASTALAFVAQPALAQQSAPDSAQPELEEIVVSAQKRTERLQDVPVSVQVVGGAALAEQNRNDLSSLTQTVPSVNISPHPRSASMFIRGVGSGENPSFDQSVGTFIDDIFHGRARTSAATFLDLDRVEVLKGPQSTFFGNSAIAGALNIITRKPSRSLEASGRALYGEDGQFALEAAAGGPVTDSVGVRVAGIYNGGDGWVRNVNLDREEPRVRNWAGRATVAFRPSSDFDVTFKYERSRSVQHSNTYLQVADCPPPAPFVPAGFCSALLAQNLPTGISNNRNAKEDDGTRFDNHEYVLTADYELGDATLSSVTGYYNFKYDIDVDVDMTPTTLLTATQPEKYRQFSQEVRLVSAPDKPIEYAIGGYFQRDRLDLSQTFNYFFLTPVVQSTPGLAPLVPTLPLSQTNDSLRHQSSYAVFGSLSWNVTDKLKITGGLRDSWVNKRFDLDLSFGTASAVYGGAVRLPDPLQAVAAALGLATPGNFALKRKDHATLPSGKIQYNFDDNIMAYGSYARGFKAGGFNSGDTTGTVANIPFEPEYVNAYEIGLKSKLLDNQLLFNVAVFRSDYEDLQVATNITSSAGAPQSVVRNAANSRSQGVEVETDWAVSRALRLTLNGAYVDSKYVKFVNATPTMLQLLNGQGVQDLSGRPTTFAPRWSGNLVADYQTGLSDSLTLEAQGSAFYSSRYFLDGTDDPQVAQGAYVRIDGRITLSDARRRWAVDLIGKNLTNRSIVTFAQAFVASLGSVGLQRQQPRNFAIQVRYSL